MREIPEETAASNQLRRVQHTHKQAERRGR